MRRYRFLFSFSVLAIIVLFASTTAYIHHQAVIRHETAFQEQQSLQVYLAKQAFADRIDWHLGELPSVRGDEALLRLVLLNLIANALKFTRSRETARIEIGSKPAQNGEALIFVRDNGVGFDMAHADKLFGVFQRLHREEEFEGTGIGLATVQRIIARHGGRLWCDSAPAAGATFYFTID